MINRSADVNQPKQDGKERTYGDFINFAEIEKIGLRAICIIGLAFRGDGPELKNADVGKIASDLSGFMVKPLKQNQAYMDERHS